MERLEKSSEDKKEQLERKLKTVLEKHQQELQQRNDELVKAYDRNETLKLELKQKQSEFKEVSLQAAAQFLKLQKYEKKMSQQAEEVRNQSVFLLKPRLLVLEHLYVISFYLITAVARQQWRKESVEGQQRSLRP